MFVVVLLYDSHFSLLDEGLDIAFLSCFYIFYKYRVVFKV